MALPLRKTFFCGFPILEIQIFGISHEFLALLGKVIPLRKAKSNILHFIRNLFIQVGNTHKEMSGF